MSNFFLPQKSAQEVNYTLPSVGTFSWTAPNALNTGGNYQITLQMWGGGSGGSSGDTTYFGGAGGAGGGYVYSKVTVVPGTVYTFRVGNRGSGGAAVSAVFTRGSAGGVGLSSYISDGSGIIISANGGGAPNSGGGSGPTVTPVGGTGAGITTSQPSKVTGTLSLNGGNVGGNSASGSSVSGLYSQPGGAGGSVGGGAGGSPGSGGGASAQTNGGGGGSHVNQYSGGSGGGGGAGFTSGVAGSATPNIGSSSSFYYYGAAGGNGGIGRVTFLFVVSNGGSAGVAPV